VEQSKYEVKHQNDYQSVMCKFIGVAFTYHWIQ